MDTARRTIIDPTCQSCGADRRVYKRVCVKCGAKFPPARNRRYAELSEHERQRSKVRSKTHMLIKRGKIQRKPCACGNPTTEAHHPDYERPDLVVFMCRDCHSWHHLFLDTGEP